MLEAEIVIAGLDQYLEDSKLYYASEEEAEPRSKEIKAKWVPRLSEALKKDFYNYTGSTVSVFDEEFELFGDQGASIWWCKITLEGSHPVVLSLKAIINYRKVLVSLSESSLRAENYSGRNKNIQKLFQKLKVASVDGYESRLLLKEVLVK